MKVSNVNTDYICPNTLWRSPMLTLPISVLTLYGGPNVNTAYICPNNWKSLTTKSDFDGDSSLHHSVLWGNLQKCLYLAIFF